MQLVDSSLIITLSAKALHRRIYVAMVLVMAVFLVGLALHIRSEYLRYRSDLRVDVRNLALVIEAHANTVFEHARHVFVGIEDTLAERQNSHKDGKLREVLEKWKATSPVVRSIFVVDASGNVRHGTDGSPTEPRLFGGAAITSLHPMVLPGSRADNIGLGLLAPEQPGLRPHLFVSRGLHAPDGRLHLVSVVVIDASVFGQLYGALELKPGRAVSIVRKDGLYMLREPHHKAVGTSLADSNLMRNHVPFSPQGDFIGQASTDGKERQFAYRSLENFPLLVVVGLETEPANTEWRQRSLFVGIISMLTMSILMAFLFRLLTLLLNSERQAVTHAQRLSALAVELERSEALERKKLSHEMHDGIAQSLAMAISHLSQLEDQGPGPAGKVGSDETAAPRQKLKAINSLIRQANEEARILIGHLSPPSLGHLGLAASLQWLADHMANQYGLCVDLRDDGQPKVLEDWRNDLVFRAVRELLINISKHAGVDRAEVVCERIGEQINIMVSDEGCGFDAESVRSTNAGNKFGLFALSERMEHLGGELNIDSGPGRGTVVHLSLPMGDAGMPGQAGGIK